MSDKVRCKNRRTTRNGAIPGVASGPLDPNLGIEPADPRSTLTHVGRAEHNEDSTGSWSMRKWMVLLVGLALIATACGSDGDGADVGAAPESASGQSAATSTEPASGDGNGADVETTADLDNDGAPADAPDRAPDDATGVDDEPEASAGTGPEPTCGFDDDLEPEPVVIAQIPADAPENGIVSALRDMRSPNLPDPLVDLDRIISGGPPPDGIPPIDAPNFQTVASVDWLRCNEPVLSLQIGDEARAYPVQVMTWHELVNDSFGDVPVTVSYCPLCSSALAYRRDVAGRIVTFGTSGRLFNSSLVMYDRQTESLWTHFNGAAVAGELTGTELELLPIQTLSWKSFRDANPDGIVLTTETGFNRPYGANPYSGYDNVGDLPFLFDGEYDERLAAKQRVVAIRRGDDSVAIVLEPLAEAGVLDFEIGGGPVSVWHLPGTSTALEGDSVYSGRDIGAVGVFVPELDGVPLSFTRTADGFVDDAGATWNILGEAIDGPNAGSRLEGVEHLDTFWFAIAAFEPDTLVLP